MDVSRKTDRTHQGIFGTGFAAWLLLFVCLLMPEWTREDEKHCGVFFCCVNYNNCSVTDSEIVANPLPWVLAAWLFSFVGVCSALCRCSKILPENVRHMAIMCIVSGVFALTGSSQFIAQKFVLAFSELNFGFCGFFTHIAGWMLFISGLTGFCHGYGYHSHNNTDQAKRKTGQQPRFGPVNEVYPMNQDMMEMGGDLSPYRRGQSPGNITGGQQSRLTRFRENFLPNNFARRFWRDAVAATNESLDRRAHEEKEASS